MERASSCCRSEFNSGLDSRVSGSSGPPSCLSLMDRDFVALILLAGAAIFAALVVAQYYGIVHIQVLSDLSAFVNADD